MTAITETPIISTAELLTLPRNGVERWLIEGQLREKPMTVRNRVHSRIMARTTNFLVNWSDGQPEPRGEVLCGEAGCRLQRDPDTTVGMDVAYVTADVARRESLETTLIDGVPLLIVEILSPNDTIDEIEEKIGVYQKAGVPLIWVINPYRRTITVYRLDAEPELINIHQDLTAEPYLPGFRVPAAQIFA